MNSWTHGHPVLVFETAIVRYKGISSRDIFWPFLCKGGQESPISISRVMRETSQCVRVFVHPKKRKLADSGDSMEGFLG